MHAWLFSMALAAAGPASPPPWEIPADYSLAERTAYRTDPAKAARARELLEQGLDTIMNPGAPDASMKGRALLAESAQYGNPHAAGLLCSLNSSGALGVFFMASAHVWCSFALRITPPGDAAALARARANLAFADGRLNPARLHDAELQERTLYAKVREKIDEPSTPQAKPTVPSAEKEAALRELEAAIDARSRALGDSPSSSQPPRPSAEDGAASHR